MSYDSNKSIRTWSRGKTHKGEVVDDGSCEHRWVQMSYKWKHCVSCKRYRLN